MIRTRKVEEFLGATCKDEVKEMIAKDMEKKLKDLSEFENVLEIAATRQNMSVGEYKMLLLNSCADNIIKSTAEATMDPYFMPTNGVFQVDSPTTTNLLEKLLREAIESESVDSLENFEPYVIPAKLNVK